VETPRASPWYSVLRVNKITPAQLHEGAEYESIRVFTAFELNKNVDAFSSDNWDIDSEELLKIGGVINEK